MKEGMKELELTGGWEDEWMNEDIWPVEAFLKFFSIDNMATQARVPCVLSPLARPIISQDRMEVGEGGGRPYKSGGEGGGGVRGRGVLNKTK